jgi:hypothetical protein
MKRAKKPTRASNGSIVGAEDMFSAASFAGVVSGYDERTWREPEELGPASPPVVAFYGLRGGAGRTTALAYVAALLAARQMKVVAVDLDLEAPGLHHVLACPQPEEDRGVLALLREAATSDLPLRLAPHITRSGLDIGAPIRVLAAGVLSERYLERLDDLGVALWHVVEGPSPLSALIERVKVELAPEIICLDCRTGLNGLSASALFHVADVVTCFLPVSEQALEGLDVFLKALKAAKRQRSARPEALIVPSMVPEGPEGRARVAEWLVPQIEAAYARVVLGAPTAEDDGELVGEQVPLVREGIEYRRGIALADQLRPDFAQLSAGVYQPLMRELDAIIGLSPTTPVVDVDCQKVLHELATGRDLERLAFAETADPAEIVSKFIQPSAFKAIVDRSTWYVVGAKGAGKTWLWTYLLSDVGNSLSAEMRYLPGHGPRQGLLSSNALRELERDKTGGMDRRSMHGAMWLLYAAKRLLSWDEGLVQPVVAAFRADEKRCVRRLIEARDEDLQEALGHVLAYERASTLAERLIRALDAEILARGIPAVTLLYDGLDVGFGSDDKSIAMRRRFVNALVDSIEPLRGTSRRIFFKVFVREDIFGELDVQNQSHLAAAKVELQWEPRDLWVLALNLVASSQHYREVIRGIEPSAGPGAWPIDNDQRLRLLSPLWGAQMERGNKVSTALFVQRRTADGKGRLFPRTLVQLLAGAVEHQKTLAPFPDRVLRSASISAGYTKASAKRVEDLRKEYAALGPYLDGLRRMKPTGTEAEITSYLRGRIRRKTQGKGAETGALHAGPGGWRKVIDRLLEIGVLREYRRARGEAGEQKYEVALLYRPGLSIKAYGV